MSITPEMLTTVENYDDEKRLQYLLQHVVTHNEIWVLTDEHGCMMLNTEDEDCVPVWPNEAFAKRWITDEWQGCTAEAISLNKWFSRWTMGLSDDELALVVFPSLATHTDQQGLVLYPEEFELALQKAQKKLKNK